MPSNPPETRPTPTPGSLHGYALRYARLGWRVLPLHGIVDGACTCGRDCKTPGKHPDDMLARHGAKDATTDPAQLAAWFAPFVAGQRNIGIVCDAEHVVIDVDPRNGGDATFAALIEQHGELPATWVQNTGGGGQHYVLTVPAGTKLPGQLGPGVDVKGEGGYIACEPSIHASGRAYAWSADADPADGAPIAPAPEWILASKRAPVLGTVTDSGDITVSPAKVNEIRSALNYIDADERETWLAVGMALHSTGFGKQARGLWDEWSQKSKKYEPVDQTKTWRSFKPQEWGQGTGLGTLFKMAKDAGWCEPVAPADRNAELRAVFAEPDSDEPAEVVELPVLGPCPVPEFDELTRELSTTFGLDENGGRALAIAFVCTLAARRYIEPTHVYLMACCEDDNAKRRINFAVRTMFEETGHDRLLHTDRIGTTSNLNAALISTPAFLYAPPDLDSQMEIARKMHGGQLPTAWAVMAEILPTARKRDIRDVKRDADSASIEGSGKGKGSTTIYVPALSILAAIHRHRREVVFNARLSGYDLAKLCVWFDATAVGVPPRDDYGTRYLTPSTIARARSVALLPSANGLSGHTDMLSNVDPIPALPAGRTQRVADECRAVWDGLVDHDARNARRIAVAVAAWGEPEDAVVAPELAAWTRRLVENGRAEFKRHANVQKNDDGKAPVTAKVLAAIEKAGRDGLRERDLQGNCHQYRALSLEARDEVIDSLTSDRLIEHRRGRRGGRVFYLARYAPDGGGRLAMGAGARNAEITGRR